MDKINESKKALKTKNDILKWLKMAQMAKIESWKKHKMAKIETWKWPKMTKMEIQRFKIDEIAKIT